MPDSAEFKLDSLTAEVPPVLLSRERSGLLIVDMQEAFRPTLFEFERTLKNVLILLQGCQVLGLPIFITEQNPEKLGVTVAEIRALLKGIIPIPKMTFSCLGAASLKKSIRDQHLKTVIVCGIEAHVCVNQTVLELLSQNYRVQLAVDAITSRNEMNYWIGIRKMISVGAVESCSEAILYELLRLAGTSQFREILKLVK